MSGERDEGRGRKERAGTGGQGKTGQGGSGARAGEVGPGGVQGKWGGAGGVRACGAHLLTVLLISCRLQLTVWFNFANVMFNSIGCNFVLSSM